MSAPSKHIGPRVDLESAIVILVALILGFICGIVYADHVHQTTQPTTLPARVCSCPNIPVGSNPEDVCHC